eukprot:12707985-Alexandrium_andersonii.AAC.1
MQFTFDRCLGTMRALFDAPSRLTLSDFLLDGDSEDFLRCAEKSQARAPPAGNSTKWEKMHA